jgi:hypothetical protein
MPLIERPATLRPNALFVLFLLAVALRVVGATFNLEANDPHIEVSQIMAFEHRVPADGETWEAFQPKLYHAAVAAVIAVLPPGAGQWHMLAAQWVSCLAGVATLWLVLSLLNELPLSQQSRTLTFALVAFNPKMIAISIQATNDAFVVLFGTLALVGGWRYLRAARWRDWLMTTAGVLLVCVSKANGIPVALAVAVLWLFALLPAGAPRGRILAGGMLALAAFAAFVPIAGGFWERFRATGSAVYIPMDPAFPLHFSDPTLSRRPGIISVVDSYLTFRLPDLLTHPVVSNAADDYAANRTSLWSFAYASALTHHYDNYPPSWQADTPTVRMLLRGIYLAGLLPVLVLVMGYVASMRNSLAGLFRWRLGPPWGPDALLAAAGSASLAFLVAYTWQYRDFGCMKPIFCYPAIAAIAVYFARAYEGLGPLLRPVVTLSCLVLLAAQLAETVLLLERLVLLRLHLA